MQPGACAVAPAPRAVERPGGRSEASKVKALSLSARALALAYRSFRFGARGVPWPFGIELQTQLHHLLVLDDATRYKSWKFVRHVEDIGEER